MASNSGVVGMLRVLLSMDAAEFTKATQTAAKQAKAFEKSMASAGRQMTAVGAALTKTLTLPIVGLGVASAKAAIDFESSFAGVRKTVNATEAEFALLAQGMRDLSKEIPINVNELNKIGEAAGQLGIKTENILGFTEVMAKLGVTTNLSAEQAATSLARLANITGMPQTEFDRLGSTIVALGNSFATTEAEIVDFGLRIAGAGAAAGMTQPQILAIGTALSSLGVPAEAGGTAVQKVILNMLKAVQTGNKDLEKFAKTAKMSAAEFSAAFREDAGAAFTAFVVGLGEQGDNAINVLDELGLADQRLIRSFLALSGASEKLTEAMALGADEWRKNTALTEEAQKRFGVTAEQLKLLWGRVRDVGITLGNALLPAIQSTVGMLTRLVPILEKAAQGFGSLPGPVQMIGVGLLALVAAAGPAIYILGQLALSAASIAKLFTGTGVATTALTKVFGSAAGAASVFGRALAVLTGPVGWIVGIGASVLTAANAWEEFGRILRGVAEVIRNVVVAQFRRYVDAAKEVIDWSARIAKATGIDQWLKNVGDEAKRLGEATKAGLGRVADGIELVATATGNAVGPVMDLDAALKAFEQQDAATVTMDFETSLALLNSQLAVTIPRTGELTDEAKKLAAAVAAVNADVKVLDQGLTLTHDQVVQTIDPMEALGLQVAAVEDATVGLTDANFALAGAWRESVIPGAIAVSGRLADIENAAIATAASLRNVGTSVLDPIMSGPGLLQRIGADLAKGLGPSILGAFQGGGDVGKSIGGFLGGSIGTNIATGITKAIGGKLGSLIGSVIPGLGTLLGGLAGGLFGKLFGTSESERVRDMTGEVIRLQGGFDGLAQKIHAATGSQELFQRLLDAKTEEEYEAAIRDIDAALGDLDQRLTDLRSAAETTAGKMGGLRAMTPGLEAALATVYNAQTPEEYADAMARVNDEVDEALKKQRDTDDAFQALGFTFAQLPKAIRDQKLGAEFDQWQKYINLAVEGGADLNFTIRKAGSELSQLVQTAEKTGTEIPRHLKPTLLQAADLGVLIDANGKKITRSEVEAMSFGDTFEAAGDQIETAMDRVIQALDLIIARLEALDGTTVDTTVNVRQTTYRNTIETEGSTNADTAAMGGLVTPSGVQHFGAGGIVAPSSIFQPRGTDTVPAMLTVGEEVTSVPDRSLTQAALAAVEAASKRPIVVDNHIIIDGVEMRRWQREAHLQDTHSNTDSFRVRQQRALGVIR